MRAVACILFIYVCGWIVHASRLSNTIRETYEPTHFLERIEIKFRASFGAVTFMHLLKPEYFTKFTLISCLLSSLNIILLFYDISYIFFCVGFSL